MSNYKSKSRFIDYLIDELRSNAIDCYQEKGEADELIVEIALKDDSRLNTIIAAEDMDILVILTARVKSDQAVNFVKLNKLKVEILLQEFRYESFIKVTTKNSAVKLSSLVPTVDA